MGQKGGQKGQESYHSDRVWVKKEVKMAFINGSKILPKRRSYQKWVKKEVKKRVKEGLDQRELFMLRGIPYVKVLLLTVPIVVMLLVLTHYNSVWSPP